MAGSFTTLSASSTVNFTSGAQTGYLWQCTNGATGLGSWVALSAISGAGGALTVSNDTNITATFTGSSSTALLTPITINLAWASTLATSRGGTNFNGAGLTLGDILYASSGTAFSRLAGNTTGNTRKFLVSTASSGVATAPTWDYLTGADFANMVTSLSSIGFGMSAPTNAYISSTSRTGIAGANYQVSLGGTYTAISSSTSIIDLDITTTHISTTSALTTSAGLQITPNTNATSGGITSNYGILIGTGTNAGGTITTNYGIFNASQTTGSTNYGYYQNGTFTKANDIGVYLSNGFIPTSSANIRQLVTAMTVSSTSAALTSVYGYVGQSLYSTTVNNSTTLAEIYLSPTFTVNNVGIVTEADALLISPSISITTATTGTRVTNMYGIKVQIAAGPTITTASTVLGTYYNIYSGTSPTLTGSGKYGTVYGGYFAAPLTTTTDASTGSVALWADSLQVGGAVSGASTTGTILATTYAVSPSAPAYTNNGVTGGPYTSPCLSSPYIAAGPYILQSFEVSSTSIGTSITFSSIPNTFRHLKIIAYMRVNNASDASIGLNWNGNNTNGYYGQWVQPTGSSVTTGFTNNQGQIYIGTAPGGSGPGTSAEFLFPDYTGSYNKSVSYFVGSTRTTVAYAFSGTGAYYNDAAVISSIRITITTLTFNIGSRFVLYGMY